MPYLPCQDELSAPPAIRQHCATITPRRRNAPAMLLGNRALLTSIAPVSTCMQYLAAQSRLLVVPKQPTFVIPEFGAGLSGNEDQRRISGIQSNKQCNKNGASERLRYGTLGASERLRYGTLGASERLRYQNQLTTFTYINYPHSSFRNSELG
jgi:hypothetical protein